MGLEQAADQDHQGEAQEQSGELLAGHRQEQRVRQCSGTPCR
jgi:hypothetical protein